MPVFDQLFQRTARPQLERQFSEGDAGVRVYPLNGQIYDIDGTSVNLKNGGEEDSENSYNRIRKIEATITCRYHETEGMTDQITGWAISLAKEDHARKFRFEKVLSVNDSNLVAIFIYETLTEAGRRK